MPDTSRTARRHHYVPQFYLKVWKDSDGKGLWLYAHDEKRGLRAYRRSPKSVGFVHDLYALSPETEYPGLNYPPDAIETKFFAVIDDSAALAHQKLLSSGIRHLTSEDRMLWGLFLNSLLERNPRRIEEIEQFDSVENIQHKVIQEFGNSEFLNKLDLVALHQNSVRLALVNFIKDGSFIRCIADMQWTTVDITINGEHLITSDIPLILNAGAGGQPIHCLSIAISPKRLLIIRSKSDEFDEDFVRTLAVMHNMLLIKQAANYVISSKELVDGPHTKYSRFIAELLKDRNPEGIKQARDSVNTR
jgi:hypothetical protein